ncbi:hypothetical protein J53TS2_39210 [Paenibacillus sp. J53TS2]|uniref:FAD-dependent oxidoreductase n=1 Tax=Paenibacillus sp. J53TS2 TaxID=2807197 RepID=UPI001B2B64E7|nr:FAD-dependent oxidoreductase [Paenibacillus sp. J53TS2]GIP50330.1 hypothetical protein J53TS2_39210 [Paenibacillus sp. J53TS2]
MKSWIKSVTAGLLGLALVLGGAQIGSKAVSDVNAAAAQGASSKTGTATEKGFGGDVKVALTVDGKKITNVTIQADKETPEVGGAAAKKLQEQIVAKQNVELDAIAGASHTSAAVMAAAKAALAQTGLKPSDLQTVTTGGKVHTATADVVVVGGGTSGTAAALAAVQNGAKVIVLEKTSAMGGLLNYAMGIAGTETSLQKKAGETVTTEYLFNYLEKYNHYRSNAPLLKAVLNKSGSTIDWLQANGIGLRLSLGVNQKLHVDSPKTYHLWTNAKADFAKLHERMQKELGVDVRFNTTGQSLITDAKGRVTGVTATMEDGSTLKVTAKNVILASGGFGANEEMFKEKTKVNYYNYYGWGNKGEGVKMAWAIGADEIGSGVIQIHLGDLSGTKGIFENYNGRPTFTVKDLPLFWVNKEGTRFVDEGVVYDNVLWGNAAYSVGGEYFAVIDQATVDKLTKEGSSLCGAYQVNGDGLFAQGRNDVTKLKTAPIKDLQSDLETFAKDGVVAIGKTLDDLAAKTGMNAAKLKSSAQTYNQAVAAKKDTLYYKDPAYLQYKIEKGPFYAIRVSGSTYGSIGGVRVNEDLQALTAEGKVIPGLYAVGNDAGGLYDNSYPDVEGLTMAFAVNSGRIAGEHAASHK